MMYNNAFASVTVAATLGFFSLFSNACHAAISINWTTAYNQASTGTNQLRAVALADDGNSVYTGFIQVSGNRRINQFNTSGPFPTTSIASHASGNDQPKGIATDNRGNVFVSNRNSGTSTSRIQSFTSGLIPVLGGNSATTGPVIGGIAVQQVGSTYHAYVVYEGTGLIERYNVTNTAAIAIDASFNGIGSYSIAGATDLRGIEIGSDGSLYVASRGDAKVYKVSSDLSSVTSAAVTRAMDVALYGGNIYATSYDGVNSKISILNQTTLALVDTITVGSSTLNLGAYSRGSSEGWGGIDIDTTGRIWLADQHYGSTGGTQDRLLVSSALAPVPEPAMLLVFGIVMCMAPLAARSQRDLSN